MLVRNGEIVHMSKEQTHGFNVCKPLASVYHDPYAHVHLNVCVPHAFVLTPILLPFTHLFSPVALAPILVAIPLYSFHISFFVLSLLVIPVQVYLYATLPSWLVQAVCNVTMWSGVYARVHVFGVPKRAKHS